MLKRLPDGKQTNDSEVYQRAWMQEAELVEDLFPGYTLSSFDPTLTFTNFKTWDHFTLTLPAARALTEGMNELVDDTLSGIVP